MTIFLLRGISLPILPHISQKNERGIRQKCTKHRKFRTVLNRQKRTICVFKCWLNCQLASFEALRSLEQKNINRPCHFQCLTASIQKRCPSKMHDFPVFSYHIGGTCPVKECSWSRNGAFFGDRRKATTHIHSEFNANNMSSLQKCGTDFSKRKKHLSLFWALFFALRQRSPIGLLRATFFVGSSFGQPLW